MPLKVIFCRGYNTGLSYSIRRIVLSYSTIQRINVTSRPCAETTIASYVMKKHNDNGSVNLLFVTENYPELYHLDF